jgi:isocitrate dehydrogenase kinase/phosphatase
LYCDFLQHLASSDDKFEIAEGEKGMVMEVFTMPDYDLVFKVIKDQFSPAKRTTREEVMAKYDLVFKHDRAGRLVDAQEFEHLEFSLTAAGFQENCWIDLRAWLQKVWKSTTNTWL